jgi:hypothetical protein
MMYVSSSASCSSGRRPFIRADPSGVQLRLIQDLYGLTHDGRPRGEATFGGVMRHPDAPSGCLYFLLSMMGVRVLLLISCAVCLHLAILDSQWTFPTPSLDRRSALIRI